MRTVVSWRASGIAVVATALLTAMALAGCGTAVSGAGASSPGTPTTATPGTSPGAGSSATELITPPPSPTSPATGTPATGTPAGGPVPSGFAATSVTFVSADEAFVLGTAPCASKPCTSIVRTLNRGVSWVGLPAPVMPLGQPENNFGPAVWGIRFATPSHGFVFGNGLWETTNGGEYWAPAAGPGGTIISLEIIDGEVLAVTDQCDATSLCAPVGTLSRRALDGIAWSKVASVTVGGEPVDTSELIGTQGRVAAVLDGYGVLVTTDGGLTTAVRSTPCDKPGVATTVAVTVTGPDSLALLCSTDNGAMGTMGKSVYTSSDLGAAWTPMASPPITGDPAQLAGGTPGSLVVSAFSGASWLYYSANGAASWSTALETDNGGAGWNDLGFTTTSDGVIVSGPATTDGNPEGKPGQLLLTSNGGATWQPVTW